MAVVTKGPQGSNAGSNVYANALWANSPNVSADDFTYATITNLGRNKEGGTLWRFDFTTSDIPAGSTINSVTVGLKWMNSISSTNYSLRSTMFDGSDDTVATALSANPGVSVSPTPTTRTLSTYLATPTLAQLYASVWVRATALQGSTNTGSTFSLDYISITVDYTAPTNVNNLVIWL